MAAALPGKCIGLLALVVLLYTCCYAFRIRDAPAEHAAQRTGCGSIFGRCSERSTSSPASTARKWHEIVAPRRKPPVEVTSLSDEQPRDARHERTSSRVRSVEEEDDEDDDDVLIEIEDESEEVVSEGLADVSGAESDDEEADEEDSEKDEDDEVDEEEDEKEKKSEPKKFGATRTKMRAKGDEEEDEEDEKKDAKWTFRKSAKVVKPTKRKEDEEDESIEKDVEKPSKKDKAEDTKDMKKRKEEDEDDVDEDEDEDEEDDEDDDEEDEEDEEEEKEEPPTPPPRKLEKVRLADKEKARPTEPPPKLAEEPKTEIKKPVEIQKQQQVTKKPAADGPQKGPEESKKVEVPKKTVEPQKRTPEVTKKSTEPPKKSADSKKPAEVAKKGVEETGKRAAESAKVTKSESETTKKPGSKQEEKPKPSTKSGKQGVTKEQSKQPEKSEKMKTTERKLPPAKPVEASRADKKESEAKGRKGGDAPITLAELNEAILHVPTFVPNFTAVENLECQQHGKIFLRQLRGYRLWALQMLDSNAKVPSGLLRGNVNQFGDFDQCLGVIAHVKVDDKTIRVQGKYCLASIDLHASHPDMKFPVNLIQSRAFVRGNMRDPGHFIPKFTTVNWALCLPAACSAEDAEAVLRNALAEYNVTAGIRFSVDVDPDMCYVKPKARTYSKETIGVLYFYAMIACLVLVATIRDYMVEQQGKGNYSERIIMSFSLRRTLRALLKEESKESDITCIHGIRAIVTCALYVAHQLIPLARLPYANRVSLTEIANNPLSSLLRVSMVYTDACLLLSGVLTAYNMANENTKRGEIRWFCRFIARYVRLTPALLVVVFWYAFVMEHTGSGPLWNSVVMPNAELCKNNAWTNLLYIQNFFPFEEMCATHTHQLALDMQLSLLAPMIVFFLQCKIVIGLLLISFFVLLSATLRYISTVNNYLSLVIYHGMSIKQLYKTANYVYALPLHRATPYILGVGLGVLLHYSGKNVRIHKVFVILGWLIAMALGSWSLFSPWRLARRDYVYDAEEAASYAVISPVSWALALCWFIFACFTNNGGAINRFLSNYWLVVFSRISYAVYLTQFAVFFYNVGTTRYATEFQLHRAIDPLEAITVIAASIALTLLFDLPMQEVKSVIMESTDGTVSEIPSEEKNSTGGKVKDKLTEGSTKNGKEEREVLGKDDDIVGDESKRSEVEEVPLEAPVSRKPDSTRRGLISHDSIEPDPMPTWDWIRRPSDRLSREDSEYGERGRISRSSHYDSDEEALEFLRIQQAREEAIRRGRRSLSRGLEAKRLMSRESEDESDYARTREVKDDPTRWTDSRTSRERSIARDPEDYRSWEFINKERSSSRGPEIIDGLNVEDREPVSRQSRSPVPRSVDTRRILPSESEEDPEQKKKTERKHVVEPRISDEEEWESELRIRRKQFTEKLAMQDPDSLEEEEDLSSLRRRSSAEGKIALLRDPSSTDNMDSWTVSVGPRLAQMGSSQEPSEPEDDAYARRKEYRERAPPSRDSTYSEEETWDSSRRRSYTSGSQVTSLEEEEEDISTFNFVLTKDSKRISLQDLSKVPSDDTDLSDSGWNVVRETGDSKNTLGLYKRESIVKSQASEEDPEYLLPERPKLVQQEREHPFKKAWQMQKSRSEEDGSAAYVIRELKDQQSDSKTKDQESLRREPSTEQSDDVGSLADDESESATLSQSRSISTDTEGNRTSSKSDETEPISTDSKTEEEKGNSITETDEDESSRFTWPTEQEQFHSYKSQRMSEEVDWEHEET